MHHMAAFGGGGQGGQENHLPAPGISQVKQVFTMPKILGSLPPPQLKFLDTALPCML